MGINYRDDLPMIRLETLLKNCYLQREDIHDRILSADELAEYIGWMAAEFGGKQGYRMDPGKMPELKGISLHEVGERIMRDPGDRDAIDQIQDGYRYHREDKYIVEDNDISVMAIMRYMPAHWHADDFFNVYYALSGECRVAFANETAVLRRGSILIAASGVVHATPCYSDDAELICYMLRASTFDKIFWQLLPKENLMAVFFSRALNGRQPNAYLQFETGDDEDIRHVMLQIYREYIAGERYTVQLIDALMSAAFTMVLRHYEGTAKLPRTEQFYWKHEYSAILSYIQTSYQSVSLAELSEKFHYNEKQIRRIVEQSTGMTFRALITKLRMDNAVAMIRRGMPIESVAYSVGYTSVSSFYRAFTACFGMTPGEYR